MTKHTPKTSHGRSIKLIFLGMICLGLLLAVLLRGTDIATLNPQGLISGEEHKLILLTTGLLLLIAVPTMFLFYFFAWKYRETNEQATYEPNARHSKKFMGAMWAIPCVFMVGLSLLMWSATHRLEPQKAIAAEVEPLTVQVVAMRWKWLFIYPEQQIATVNFVQIPVGTPVQFKLTADEVPMSSFWIPHLSGQLYAMTGHVNRLNLVAEKPGDYPGSSAEINGAGFAGMKFIARATSKENFDSWAGSIQQSFVNLDADQYSKLLKPTENNQYEYFSLPAAGLYDKVVMKYSGSHTHEQQTKIEPQMSEHSHMDMGH